MSDKDLYQEGENNSKKRDVTRHDISLVRDKDQELGLSQDHDHRHSLKDSKKQSKHGRDKGVANLKNDEDYDDLIAETHDGAAGHDEKHSLASSDCNKSLENKGKRMWY